MRILLIIGIVALLLFTCVFSMKCRAYSSMLVSTQWRAQQGLLSVNEIAFYMTRSTYNNYIFNRAYYKARLERYGIK